MTPSFGYYTNIHDSLKSFLPKSVDGNSKLYFHNALVRIEVRHKTGQVTNVTHGMSFLISVPAKSTTILVETLP